MLELTLHLEKSVISLKMDALRMWSIALASTTCGNLLSLIKTLMVIQRQRPVLSRGPTLRHWTETLQKMPPMWSLLMEPLQRRWMLLSLNHLPLHQKEGRSAHRALTKSD